ncbi:MAG TPA: S53 family peptidase [Steroidobacteraceae bacterium]|jgi:kumamolisin
MARVTLKGSERSPIPGSRIVAPAAADERLEVTVLVRRRRQQELHEHIAALDAGRRVSSLTREEFAQRHGADAADLKAVSSFAQEHGLAVVQTHAARRTVVLSGTVRQFSDAFSVQLHHCHYDGGSYRGRSGAIQLPTELDGIVVAVLGLDNRPQAKAHFRVHPNAAAATSFSPLQVAALYGFPAGSGEGQCVGIIELGGGFKPADLQTYFSGLGVGSPSVIAVSVDNANNTPTGDSNGPDGEVMLDIEVVGSIVPSAKVAVYFAPNTDAGFLNAITSAVHDTVNKPSVISISWGGPESSWTAQAMTSMDDALQAAATMGVTVCVASGDNGSSDGVSDGADHVDFPASSPFALACGGTTLSGAGSTIRSESVWNDGANGGASGGGESAQFALPSWQANLSITANGGGVSALGMRGVPDVAGDADPQTGYNVRVDGEDMVIGGTSAVAPLWAALVARLNQAAGKPLGYLNPTLYQTPLGFRDITQGNNGDFSAAGGWDACTGMGSPKGSGLAQALG